MPDDGFFVRVWDLVAQVPKGRVCTYGQVARMLGVPRGARLVGFALHASPGAKGGVPCHRVVFRDGSLAESFAFGGACAQRLLLEGEGVTFLPDGRVDLEACLWEA